MSTFVTVAPNLTPDVSGTEMGSTMILDILAGVLENAAVSLELLRNICGDSSLRIFNVYCILYNVFSRHRRLLVTSKLEKTLLIPWGSP